MNTDIFNMVVEDNEGLKKNCSVVAKWHDGVDYIAYTDGTQTDGETNLFVSKYITENGVIKLEPITDDLEWKKANEFLDKNLYEGD